MSSLQEIKDAIDRLGDRLGVGADSTPVVRAVERLGEQIVSRLNPSPAVPGMQRQGPQPPSQQTGSTRQPPGRPGAFDDQSLRMFSTAVGGIPILRDIVRQLGYLNQLLKVSPSSYANRTQVLVKKWRELSAWYDPMDVGPGQDFTELRKRKGRAVRGAAYNMFRQDMEVSPLAENVMKWWKQSKVGSIPGRLAKDFNILANYGKTKDFIQKRYKANPEGLSKAMGVLHKAAWGAAIGFIGVGAAVVAAGVAVVKFSSMISQANRGISGFSPLMATAFAISDIRDLFRDIKSANQRAPAEAKWLEARAKFLDAVQPAMNATFNAIQEAGAALLEVSTPAVVAVLNGLTYFIKGLADLPRGLLAWPTSMGGGGIAHNPNDPNQRKKDAAVWNEILWGQGSSADNWLHGVEEKLGAKPGSKPIERFIWGWPKWMGGEGLWGDTPAEEQKKQQSIPSTATPSFGLGNDVYGNVRFKDTGNIIDAIVAATNAMKHLDESLQKTMPGAEFMPSGIFMAGLATANLPKDQSGWTPPNKHVEVQMGKWNQHAAAHGARHHVNLP